MVRDIAMEVWKGSTVTVIIAGKMKIICIVEVNINHSSDANMDMDSQETLEDKTAFTRNTEDKRHKKTRTKDKSDKVYGRLQRQDTRQFYKRQKTRKRRRRRQL